MGAGSKIRRPKQENEIYSKRKIVMAIHGTGTKLGVGMGFVKQIVCTGISFFTDKERERERDFVKTYQHEKES